MISEKPSWARQCGRSLVLLLLPTSVVLAASTGNLEKTFDTTLNPRINIVNLTGRILVRGWDKPQVHVVYSVLSPRVEVDAEGLPPTGPADKIHFTTHVLDPLVSGNAQTADYVLDIPVGASLEVRNPQGSVRIERLQGDVAAESVGGSILVMDSSGYLAARSVGGNIEIIRPSGHVQAYSITGNLRFVSPATFKLRASTTSGRIDYEGDFMEGGDYALSAYSGDIDIACPRSASFELSAKTVRGKLENGLRLRPSRHSPSPLTSGNSLLGTHNTGKATVELTSFSGTIRITPQ